MDLNLARSNSNARSVSPQGSIAHDIPLPSIQTISSSLLDVSSARHVHKMAYLTSPILADALGKDVPFVAASVKIESDVLREYYGTPNARSDTPPQARLTVAKNPVESMISPGDFTRLTSTFEHTLEQSTAALFRIRLIEQAGNSSDRVFGLTGSHIVCGMLDARHPENVKFLYYCPMGAHCPFELASLFPENSRGLSLINNLRHDQTEDGYCALYCHSMLLMLHGSAKPGGLSLGAFPTNNQENMVQRVAHSVHSAMKVNPGLIKEFYS
jgi:hypothetical protein